MEKNTATGFNLADMLDERSLAFLNSLKDKNAQYSGYTMELEEGEEVKEEAPELTHEEVETPIEELEKEDQLKLVLDELEKLREENATLKEVKEAQGESAKTQFDRMTDLLMGRTSKSSKEGQDIAKNLNSVQQAPRIPSDYYTKELDV